MWLAGLLEAFPGRFPSEILWEVLRLPSGLLDDVLEAKAYRQVKAMVDAADTDAARERLPKTRLFLLVDEIDEELVLEETEGHG